MRGGAEGWLHLPLPPLVSSAATPRRQNLQPSSFHLLRYRTETERAALRT